MSAAFQGIQKPAHIGVATVVALAVGAAIAAGVPSATVLSLLTQATIFAIFAVGVGVLLRQNGMVSFGHAAFFGLAGYAVGILMKELQWSAEAAVLATLVGTVLFALVLGFIVVRVPGIAFGMLTIAIGQSFYQAASTSRSLTGGADGLHVDWPERLFGVPLDTLFEPHVLFLVCWVLLVLAIAGLALLLSTNFGRVTEAVRDNEERARFIGIRTLLPRVLIFALSALVTAIAGTLSTLNTGFISPESLHWSVSGSALMMVIVGGYRRLWGPALGAMVFFLARDFLGDFAEHWLAIFGVALIVVIVFAPDGLSGALTGLWRRLRGTSAGARPTATRTA